MPKLLIMPSVLCVNYNGSSVELDVKFVEGMNLYAEQWDGPVTAIMINSRNSMLFSKKYNVNELKFQIIVVDKFSSINNAILDQFSIVLAAGDNHRMLATAQVCKKNSKKIVFIIEYTLKTRKNIIFIDPKKDIIHKLWSFTCAIRHEFHRRSAFKLADGLQINGYPAWSIYKNVNKNTILYFDNRIKNSMLSSNEETHSRNTRIIAKKPLRIIFSGRLEPLKGAQDIVPIVIELKKFNIEFCVDVFGSGSLVSDIKLLCKKNNLCKNMVFHGSVDFQNQLVPYAREFGDIYLSCHRQSDPSCTYLESMGCGLPVIGYNNDMLVDLVRESQAGWTVPLGNWKALAERIADLSEKRNEIVYASTNALRFARSHSFEIEFSRRVEHLKRCL